MRRLALIAVLAAGCEKGSEPAPTTKPEASATRPVPELAGALKLSRVAWLAGTHRATSGDGTIVEEVWTEPGGGTMLGVNRTMRGDATLAWELLEIVARDGAVIYIAHPGGSMPGTEFVLQPGDGDTLRFENAEHDFPTRIIYRRIDDMRTEARAENDEKALVFPFVRVP